MAKKGWTQGRGPNSHPGSKTRKHETPRAKRLARLDGDEGQKMFDAQLARRAKEVCACGRPGSDHAGLLMAGGCEATGCVRFTWSG